MRITSKGGGSFGIDDCFISLNIHKAIEKSDWKEHALTPDIVEKMKVISTIKIVSFTDIAEKWDYIFYTNKIPYHIVKQITHIAEYRNTVPVNGEIGISAMQDQIAFMSVYETLKKWKDSKCLLEKYKELDEKRYN